MKSVLDRKREYRIQFSKEKNGCWYVAFPHWPFSHDNLAMVSGADKMLDLLSDGDLYVRVSVIPTRKDNMTDMSNWSKRSILCLVAAHTKSSINHSKSDSKEIRCGFVLLPYLS